MKSFDAFKIFSYIKEESKAAGVSLLHGPNQADIKLAVTSTFGIYLHCQLMANRVQNILYQFHRGFADSQILDSGSDETNPGGWPADISLMERTTRPAVSMVKGMSELPYKDWIC